ncbi:hypothetical protein [Nonomuraea cypriaca]|uniref:hypothetical protein n=1 Tax=Nonomuraea cypriaca TaxID=1187855 RepID=UPI001A9C2FF2|nr:hypothetical protein [Nonomuraea cypriaca]
MTWPVAPGAAHGRSRRITGRFQRAPLIGMAPLRTFLIGVPLLGRFLGWRR